MTQTSNGVKDSEFLGKKEILTQTEAAIYFNVTKMTLRTWEKEGILEPFRLGGRVYYDLPYILAAQGRRKGGAE